MARSYHNPMDGMGQVVHQRAVGTERAAQGAVEIKGCTGTSLTRVV